MHDRAVDRLRGWRPPRQRRRARVAVATTLVVGALGLAGVQFADARADAAAARRATVVADAAAATRQAALEEARGRLIGADLDLAEAQRVLAAAVATMDGTVADRETVAAELATVQAQVLELQGAVAGAEGQAFANATLVNDLASCLEGVSALLTQLSIGDRAGAVATVGAISEPCAAVGTVLG